MCGHLRFQQKKKKLFSKGQTPDDKAIKSLLNRKKRALRALRDREEVKSVQRELKRRMEDGKNTYQERTENNLQQNSLKEAWSAMRTIEQAARPNQERNKWSAYRGLSFPCRLYELAVGLDDPSLPTPPPQEYILIAAL